MPSAGLEPAIPAIKHGRAYTLNRSAIVIGPDMIYQPEVAKRHLFYVLSTHWIKVLPRKVIDVHGRGE